jgi:hypothetical protein
MPRKPSADTLDILCQYRIVHYGARVSQLSYDAPAELRFLAPRDDRVRRATEVGQVAALRCGRAERGCEYQTD